MSFILALPIFLTIVSVVVQLALMVNAKIMVAHAADAAARAAATSLPDGHPENIAHAARLALVPVCPQATTSTAPEADADAAALRTLGVNVADSFPARYTYAMDATKVSWTPADLDFASSAGQTVDVTVTYKFQLTVPGAMRLGEGENTTVGGIQGWFWEVSATSRVQTAHGRKAHADADGWPE